MNCKHWPPYYEKEVNGKCVKVLPEKPSNKIEDLVALGLIVLVVTIPFFVLSKIK